MAQVTQEAHGPSARLVSTSDVEEGVRALAEIARRPEAEVRTGRGNPEHPVPVFRAEGAQEIRGAGFIRNLDDHTKGGNPPLCLAWC